LGTRLLSPTILKFIFISVRITAARWASSIYSGQQRALLEIAKALNRLQRGN
jgi:hypothetical protein